MINLMTRLFISAGVFILAVMACFVLTPIWWKAESILDLEFAGHSGPSEWFLFSFAGFFAILVFILSFYFPLKSKSSK